MVNQASEVTVMVTQGQEGMVMVVVVVLVTKSWW